MGGERQRFFSYSSRKLRRWLSWRYLDCPMLYFEFEVPTALHLGRYKVPQKLFYLPLFLYFDMWVATNVSKLRMFVMLLQSCRMRAPNKKYSACWDIQSALFKLLLLGTHEVLVNYSNQPRNGNEPSKQMAATAGSQETTFSFFFFHDMWVLTAFPDINPNGCQFWASCLKGICQR